MRNLLAIALALLPVPALAEGQFALVLAAESYDHIRDLENPVKDATAVADLLRDLGFDVTLETDRNARRTRRALEDFAEDAEGADLVVVYYAGHGAEVQAKNLLLPVDTAVSSPEALIETAVPLDDVVTAVTSIAPAAILIIDACRDDPFAGTPLEGVSRGAVALDGAAAAPAVIAPGFARVGRADGLVYAFATAPGDTASDGDAGHSPFAEALLRHLAKPGLDVRTALTLVAQDVYDRTRQGQLPYFESALPDLVFVAGQPAEVSERDALLLAMADLDEAARLAVEALAAERQMPLAPLYAALLTLDPAQRSPAELAQALAEAADAYAAFKTGLQTLSEADPRVAELRLAAAGDLDLGQFRAAAAKFDEAIAIDDAARMSVKDTFIARTLSQADTLLLAAEAARARLDHLAAIDALTRALALYAEIAPLGLPPHANKARATAHWDLGDLHELLGNARAALQVFQDWAVIAEEQSDAAPADLDLLRDLAVAVSRSGDILQGMLDFPAAEAAFRKSHPLFETLAEQQPDDEEAQNDLSTSHQQLGDVLANQGDLYGAEQEFVAGLIISQKLSQRAPDNRLWRRNLAIAFSRMGAIFGLQGNPDRAEQALRASLDQLSVLAAAVPGDLLAQSDLAVGHEKLGRILLFAGNLAEAQDTLRKGIEILSALVSRDPLNAGWQRSLASLHSVLAEVAVQQGNAPVAVQHHRAALAIARTLEKVEGGSVQSLLDQAYAHMALADMLARPRDDMEAALAILTRLQGEGRLPDEDIQWIAVLQDALAGLPAP